MDIMRCMHYFLERAIRELYPYHEFSSKRNITQFSHLIVDAKYGCTSEIDD